MRAVADLMRTYQHVIDELVLVTGGAGVFDVEVDGALIFSKKTEGRHARDGEVLERFRALLDPGVTEYQRG